jgi:phosphate transport system ATP-binding protein
MTDTTPTDGLGRERRPEPLRDTDVLTGIQSRLDRLSQPDDRLVPEPDAAQLGIVSSPGEMAAAEWAGTTDTRTEILQVDTPPAAHTAVIPEPDAAAPFWRNAVTRSLSVMGGARQRVSWNQPSLVTRSSEPPRELATLEARDISAWFGDHNVLDRVSLTMPAGVVTALIGPSGCGKSTFLRILNRMHELVPSASLAGEVLLDGEDIYRADRPLTAARKSIGMVFQKPNPFPAMSIYDNVIAGLRLTGISADRDRRDELVETSLIRAGLWKEVRDRLRAPGGGLSGGQQQRLCIARSLAVTPRVLLMDEPCSALDPTSTRVIEETMLELVSDVTIVIVTHNMQQAQRVSTQCAFFLASQGKPGAIVEYGDTEAMFSEPIDSRTLDYVSGRFG